MIARETHMKRNPMVKTDLFSSRPEVRVECNRPLRPAPDSEGEMLVIPAFAVSVGCLILCSVSLAAQQFTDISTGAGLHRDLTRAWGNPLWGDFNNDGLLDLLVPNHEAPGGITQGGSFPTSTSTTATAPLSTSLQPRES